MTIKKSALSRAGQSKHQTAVQQLPEWKLIPENLDALATYSPLDIRINEMASEISELSSGTAYYAISIELIARRAPLTLVDFRAATHWDDQIEMASDEVKSFCSPAGPIHLPDGVLNARIEKALRFRRRGDLVRGTIFAWGLKPLPDRYRTDSIVPFRLTFTDSLGNCFPAEGTAHVTRSRRSRQEPGIPRETLFDGACSRIIDIGEMQRRAYVLSLKEDAARNRSSGETLNSQNSKAEKGNLREELTSAKLSVIDDGSDEA